MNIEQHKKKLSEEKEKLESQMADVGRRNPSVPNDWESTPSDIGVEADIVDQADVVIGLDNNTAILADLEARYDSILAALERIESGTYGKCEECGKPIEEARLNADPSALTCVAHL